MQNQFSNCEAEQIILGSIIINNNYLRSVEFLEPKHFYYAENELIFQRIIEAINAGNRSDEITLQVFFESNELIKAAGGKAYLWTLLSQATAVIDIRGYGKEVIELWQKRELEVLLKQTITDLAEKRFGFIAANLENELAGLAIQEAKQKTQSTGEILAEMRAERALGISSKFVPTGFVKLDSLLNGGIYSQQLCIIGARPSVGKTSIAQNIILNAAQKGKRCLFVSLEMNKQSVIVKFLSDLSSIESWKIQKFKTNQSESISLVRAEEQLEQMKIAINDSSQMRIGQIGQLIKQQIEKQPVDLVVVDYVQIIRGEDTRNKNEALIIKENTSMLKAFAKQYDIAVLALAQINRKAVEGAKQEPTINDFKSSGGIEEDADVAIILHRDRDEQRTESYFSTSGKLIVCKNRHGRTGEVAVKFDGEFSRFLEIGGL